VAVDQPGSRSQISTASHGICASTFGLSRMPPIRIDLHQLQPFKAVRENWYNVRPYYTNYRTAISFGSTLMSFLAIIEQIVAHGFKFPRLHPEMETEELTPSFVHVNEFVSAEELAAARAFEIQEWEQWDKFLSGLREKNRGLHSSEDKPKV